MPSLRLSSPTPASILISIHSLHSQPTHDSRSLSKETTAAYQQHTQNSPTCNQKSRAFASKKEEKGARGARFTIATTVVPSTGVPGQRSAKLLWGKTANSFWHQHPSGLSHMLSCIPGARVSGEQMRSMLLQTARLIHILSQSHINQA